ncbi:1-aminocyclopropane-1-carboxylate deaminase/D-cysteine desulfhydrase [Pedobacter sp. JCM 36344]|uniref:1-aminocyclopropane-1-carboxylate deaminase/D-cysteine desulfhydrase n=1 Tax=Pedobacter sp. JCM 36344 TaxID=3374280 RepID=UPI0039790A5F
MFSNIFSPIDRLKNSSRNQILVKRDDLIDPFISGNKWRKLKYILKEAEHQDKKHIVTFGGAYSNHLVATAAACSRSRFKSTAFVRGESLNNEMLMICRLFGMELIFTDRESYRQKKTLYEQYFGGDPDTYFVDEGGASYEAILGCAEIIQELPEDIDHIFCAAGTGTTAAGLLKGIYDAGLSTQLHVVPVLKGGGFIGEEIIKYTGLDTQLTLHLDYHFGGYAKTTSELITFMKAFTAEEGILIDQVYTAKMFYAIDDLVKKGWFKPEEKIVALHTGGLLGLMGIKDKI